MPNIYFTLYKHNAMFVKGDFLCPYLIRSLNLYFADKYPEFA